jgi:2-polyprenyl-6-methoxyphenol hydroxylase-like FAD-dependent oxidoreductase
MPRPLADHAIVIGAGIGGLSTAAALAGCCARVTVMERDALPLDAIPRRGTPQSNHLHGLLIGGLQALCSLLPGFERDLAAAGAVAVGISQQLRAEFPGYDPFPQRDLGWTGYTMSRPLLENVVRRRVTRLPNVVLEDRLQVTEIVASDDGAVAGVRWMGPDRATGVRPADLVVDASARGSLTIAMLAETQRRQVEQTTIGIDMRYATTSFVIPDGACQSNVVMTFPNHPEQTATGYLFHVEGDGWSALISERHGEPMPNDGDGFLKLARRLRTSTIHDVLRRAKQADQVHRFAFPESSRWHFEKLPAFPRGLLPIGDAICRFNPIYGQGMTVAAKEAWILREILIARAELRDPIDGLSDAFIAAIQSTIEAAWWMSAVPDFLHPQTRGERPADLAGRLRANMALMRLAADDAAVDRIRIGIGHMVLPPSVLREPALARRIEAEAAAACEADAN